MEYPAYTSIGCYTIVYYDLKAGEPYCNVCAPEIESEGAKLVPETYDEGPVMNCARCECELESSYGEPSGRY